MRSPGATPYLRLFGLTATTAMLARGALADIDAPEAQGRAALAKFAAISLAPETAGLCATPLPGPTALKHPPLV
jgi:acyl-CoA dehydrogenase